MAFVFPNNVEETTQTTGTGNLTLDGAVMGKFAFDDTISNADEVIITITDGTDMEIIKSTFTSPSTLARAADADVIYSTNANNRVNWGAGTRNVYVSPVGELYASLHDPSASAGIVVRTAERTYAARSIAVASSFLTVTNAAGTTANPTLDFNTVAGDARYAAQVRNVRTTSSISTGVVQTLSYSTGTAVAGVFQVQGRVQVAVINGRTVTLTLRENGATGTILDRLAVGADTTKNVTMPGALSGYLVSTGSLSSKNFVVAAAVSTGGAWTLNERVMTAIFTPFSS